MQSRNARIVRGWTVACLGLPLLAACGSGTETTPTETAAAVEEVPDPSPAPPAALVADERPPSDLDVPPDHPVFGPALVVNGEVIPHERIKRHIVLGPRGQTLVESRKLQVFMEEEVARRAAAGEDVSKYKVTEADLQSAIHQAEEVVREQYPDQDVSLADLAPDMDTPLWRDQVRQSQAFDKLFLPDNPYEFPEITQLALEDGTKRIDPNTGEVLSDGTQLWTQMKEGWDVKQQHLADTGEELKDDPQSKGLLTNLMRQLVLKYLEKTAEVKRAEHGVPDHLAMIVNGHEIDVDTIWKLIEDRVTDVDVENAKLWFTNTTLARQALQAAGHWLSDEEAQRLYAEHSDPYKDSPFSVEMVALTFKKFPSVSDYKMYHRITESFRTHIADEMTDEALVAHGKERTNSLVGMGKVDCDIILLSAYDFATGKWKDDGWQKAAERAQGVIEALVKEEKTFDQLLEAESDFYDPPLPKSATQQQVARNNKGRFKGMSRNDLLQRLQESDFSIFLHGGSVGDYVFFDQEPGTIDEPIRGPHGYYIPRLNRRLGATRNLSVNDENQRVLLEQEFLSQRLVAYIQDLRDKSDVYGL